MAHLDNFAAQVQAVTGERAAGCRGVHVLKGVTLQSLMHLSTVSLLQMPPHPYRSVIDIEDEHDDAKSLNILDYLAAMGHSYLGLEHRLAAVGDEALLDMLARRPHKLQQKPIHLSPASKNISSKRKQRQVVILDGTNEADMDNPQTLTSSTSSVSCITDGTR